MLKLRQLFENSGKILKLWHRLFTFPTKSTLENCVLSFPLKYVNNHKATEQKQTALFLWQADPKQLPGIQPGCHPIHLLSALYQAPAGWFTKKLPGVCCLLAWPHVGCQLPGSCCPVHLLASCCFPDALNPLLSGSWYSFTVFTFLYISFLNAWLHFHISIIHTHHTGIFSAPLPSFSLPLNLLE